MLGVVAALFGLLLAFVIITAYENFIEAGADVNLEADSLASIVRDSTAFPEQDGERVRKRGPKLRANGRGRGMGVDA